MGRGGSLEIKGAVSHGAFKINSHNTRSLIEHLQPDYKTNV